MTTGTADVRDETVEVWDGRLRLRVKVAGDGPPLVYFHPLSGLAWEPLLDQLAQRHTVYAPEHPGTTPGEPQAITQVHTFTELLLVYEEGFRARGLERPARSRDAPARTPCAAGPAGRGAAATPGPAAGGSTAAAARRRRP